MDPTADHTTHPDAGPRLAAFVLAVSGGIGIALAARMRSRDLADWGDANQLAGASGIFGGPEYGAPAHPSLAGPLVLGSVGALLVVMAFVVVVALWTRR